MIITFERMDDIFSVLVEHINERIKTFEYVFSSEEDKDKEVEEIDQELFILASQIIDED